MVDDILVTARFDAKAVTYQKVPTDVAALVDRVVGHHRRLGATIEVDVEAVEIATDGGRLEQALRNLVSNAVTHGREPITIVGRPQGDRYQIAVCDGGEGLDERQEGDPFAPFAHAPEDVPTANSLGLGLSVASTLITGLGGSISYARRSGTTVFAISLPGTIEVPTEEPTPSNQGALEAAAH
jgi:two-component system sensor histidine kinase MtrB